jgi:glutamate racemase
VIQQSAPLLVPLIEEGWLKRPETKMILKKYLHPLKTKQIETLILACTHYPYLYNDIKKIMGQKINVPHPGEIIATSLKKYLARHSELTLSGVNKPTRQYYTTDNPELFKELAEKFLEHKISKLTQVNITEF